MKPPDLIVQAQAGRTDAVARLLDAAVPVDQAGPGGETALMAAAARGHVAAIELLLRRGAKIEAATEVGNTALMFAAARGRAAVVRLLLASGARPGHRNKYGLGAAEWANWGDDPAAILSLLEAPPG
jgi:hypothetical protein